MPDFDINPGAYYRENFLGSYNLKEVLEDKSSLPVDFRKNWWKERGEYSVNIVWAQCGSYANSDSINKVIRLILDCSNSFVLYQYSQW